MIEKYTPKVGDKVRATLGENVLVGEIWGWDTRSVGVVWELRIAGVPESIDLVSSDGWQFEQVVSVPSKFGAVIRRADGEMLTLADPAALAGRGWYSRFTDWVGREQATAGGFTVLFDGVDE